MSKVNRRKEIQEKEAFQLKFQLALSQSNKHVLNWLPNANASENGSDKEDREKFMDLPVVANGQGLFSVDDDDPSNNTTTVGDFLKSETMQKPQEIVATKDPRSGSKAMSALMNRMRTDKRKSLMNDQNPSSKGSKGTYGVQKTFKKSEILAAIKKSTKKSSKPVAADDSDDEVSKSSQITGKKKMVPQTGKKGKARPF